MPKILFIDDEQYLLDAYARMLRHSEFDCFFMASGLASLDHPRLSSVDVIVCDQQMPDITGIELLTLIKTNYPHIKRVLISGNVNSLKRCLPADLLSFDILEKPCSKAYLISCIKKITGHGDIIYDD